MASSLLSLPLVCVAFIVFFEGSKAQLKGESLSFKLAAINLPGMDVSGFSDPYVKAFSRDWNRRTYEKFGESGIVNLSRNPVWTDTFHFQYVNGTRQKWRFIIKDWDLGWNADDHLGRVEVDVEEVVNEMKKNSGNGTLRTTEPIKLFLNQPKGGILIFRPVEA